MDEAKPVILDFNMGSLDFQRFHHLLIIVDELMLELRLSPTVEQLTVLLSTFKQLYGNWRSYIYQKSKEEESGFKTKREELEKRFDVIEDTLYQLEKAKGSKVPVALDRKLIKEFEHLHWELMFIKDNIGLSAPKRFKRSLKEEMEDSG